MRKLIVPSNNIKLKLVRETFYYWDYQRKDGSRLRVPKEIMGVEPGVPGGSNA